ncbi:MAG: hypothetical protein VX938_04910 [Myxococcota bacterium]|nr:hypothetical protein [Myxococcota bacterium]
MNALIPLVLPLLLAFAPPDESDAYQQLCEETGGTYSCLETPCAGPDADCACVPSCACPEGTLWDGEWQDPNTDDATYVDFGCVEAPECEDGQVLDFAPGGGMDCRDLTASEICADTGGEWPDVMSECGVYSCADHLDPPDCEGVDPLTLPTACVCPEGQLFHETEGCVDTESCETAGDEPETGDGDEPETPDAENSGSAGGSDDGGCQSAPSGWAWLAGTLVLLGCARRRDRNSWSPEPH